MPTVFLVVKFYYHLLFAYHIQYNMLIFCENNTYTLDTVFPVLGALYLYKF